MRRLDLPRGFSLLEAIVALAIVATAGLALFAAMNQSIQMALRAETARKSDTAMRNALAWMEVVNPGQTPSGEKRLGGMVLDWKSEPVEPPRDAMTGYLQAGLYQVGLYDVTVDVRSEDGVSASFRLRKVGYKQVREPAQL
ncbi:type II secretion system protein [Stenotrophomonas acidaminiphila]|uniref:PulJ/GspJ family protein n=1 Tax=Stenotrophomonas acidaminiphila TaxID=128780 RepID=UPI0028AB3935|nr:type II secretion system protein [Stenotrophomonas acidaminiphila]